MRFAAMIAAKVADELGADRLSRIYRDEIRTMRTRSYSLSIKPQESRPEILHTLLGIELKIGRRRFACPDLATARYLRIFGRIGCDNFAIPYDVSRLSGIADRLETAWQRTLLVLADLTREATERQAAEARREVLRTLRAEIREIGAGAAMPAFNTETRRSKR